MAGRASHLPVAHEETSIGEGSPSMVIYLAAVLAASVGVLLAVLDDPYSKRRRGRDR